MPPAIVTHNTIDHASAATSRSGRRTTAKPSAKVRASFAIAAARRAGRTRSALSSHSCSRSGCPAMKPITNNAPIATGAITSPPNRIALNTAESRASTPGSNHSRKREQQQQHGDEIDHPLDENRRKRRRRAQAFLPRQQIRSNHFSRACRQHRGCGKADHRRAEHIAKLRRSQRPEQVLPPLGPNHEGQRRQRNRQRR